mmetsp:Transcript_5687/g.13845  ORF Transcript_5687/g.13845 Transcript_5687/m.13845 type:complete len:195 (-) Transcript_5687:262-846(-)|eukprot:CAMPEP_0114514404 /NCGR_PEP_ID=MMETSP0109-20121206/16135_1 /TAXON_ID=29199 /ORGANISM="Chlorarachnion reptans, Strain CCCM449" /LENGTH=194 /DNA_ID=CAMNT_0001694441 /DNA_START=324 /DNA_END=908 /DNA_ORIENTATION=-
MPSTAHPMDLDDEPPKEEKRESEIMNTRFLVAHAPLTALVKKFQGLTSCLMQKGSKEECEKRYQMFLKELAIYEHSMSKAKVSLDTMAEENKAYDQNVRTINSQIQETKRKITSLKAELDSAQKERAHREECVALAKLINQLPSRAETKAKIEKETKDLEALQMERQELEKELDTRRKQFALFHHALTEIKQSL